MKITIAKSEKEFDCIAAWRIIGEILNKPESVIGLSTGRTTGNLHRLVGEIYSRYPFDVSSVTFFGLDEVTNVLRDRKSTRLNSSHITRSRMPSSA